MLKTTKISFLINLFEIFLILMILFLASAVQFFLHELPCPLCLLQRLGFLFMAYGFLLNFRFQPKPLHYSIVILSALFTSFVALRQIALHVLPGSGAYGDPIFGLHLYTWSFIISVVLIIITTLVLAPSIQYQPVKRVNKKWDVLTHFLFALVTIIILINIVSVLLECGIYPCPDNPVSYEFLNKI